MHKPPPLRRLYQKFEPSLFLSSPTTEAVGSNFVTSIEPTALVVGAPTNIEVAIQFDRLLIQPHLGVGAARIILNLYKLRL